MGGPISQHLRSIIEGYKEAGYSYYQAHKLLLENHPDDCPCEKTVYNIYEQIDKTGHSNHFLNGNVGKKQKLSEEEEQQLVKQIIDNPALTLRKAANSRLDDEVKISFKTIGNILKKNELQAYKKPQRIFLTEIQKNERLAFAKSVQRWTHNWKQVLFSDESILKCSKIGNKYIWIKKGEEIPDNLCYEKKKYPLSIHVLGIISYDGPLFLTQVIGNLNSKAYQNILDEAFNEIGYDIVRQKYFQMDRASCHFSNDTLNWLNNQQIKYMVWPPKGADINPLEQVWGIIKDELKSLEDIGKEDLLLKAIINIFYNNKRVKQTITNCIQSLPKRIQYIIDNKGRFYNN